MSLTISGATLEAGPFDLVEPEDGWPFVLATYRLNVPTVDDIPDYIGTLIAAWRANSTITSIVPTANIRGNIPSGATSHVPYLVPTKAGGGEDPYLPILTPRVDVRCYGKTAYEAMRLFSAVHPTLVPLDRRSFGVS